LQSHFVGISNASEQEGKRPDAILFFPNDQIIIIDSKSSPHFLDLELARQNHDFEQEKILLGKIKDAFKKHLESLKKKDYSKFLFEELRSKNAADYKIMIVMFLQTEKMLEIVRNLDPEFEQKALEAGIIIASPIGLINFLSQARLVIDRIKQEKNVEDLKIEVRKLLDNVALIFKDSKELGRSLSKALTAHSKMTKNLNRGVYGAIKNIAELGITGKKSDDVKLLEEYDLNDEEL
jgi:DNA anti-recombination protein RmuC